jgi:FkbM family methyltransferase
MRFLDIGANRGDATVVALAQGYKVIACEPAPRIFSRLVQNFIYNPNVIPLRYAVANVDFERVAFYEAEEDGLSTLNKEWLTNDSLPYARKPFREIVANTVTIDTLVRIYGAFDLIKIDVEGAEWSVFRGIKRHEGELTFEWTLETIVEHEAQLDYLYSLGYRAYAPQFIVSHLERPTTYYPLEENNAGSFQLWHQRNSADWVNGGWKIANLRPTADVGMCWVV